MNAEEMESISVKNTKKDKFRLCPGCWNFSPITEDQIYCITCGEKLIEECPKCHTPVFYPTARFCPKCGETYKVESGREVI